MMILLIFLIIFLQNRVSVCSTYGYSHDSGIETNREDWMKYVSNDTLLKQISMPGTHDSLSLYGGDITQTQSKSLNDQLFSGVRAFDVRCRLYRNEFPIYHGPIYQNTNFANVLITMNQFLDSFPTEVLLMRVQEEYDAAESNLTFEQVFVNYKNSYGSRFWVPNDNDITLGSVRGKIVVLQDFSASVWYGLEYRSFNIQDDYTLNTNWDLYAKWESVRNQLNIANQNNGINYFMNYLSGSGGVFPYFVASGQTSPGTIAPKLLTGYTTLFNTSRYPDFPRVLCLFGICSIAFEGTNILATNYIPSNNLTFVGIIMIDFPGDELIHTIINLNLFERS